MVANQNQAGLALGMEVEQEYQFILFYSPFPNISHTLQNQWARYWVESGLVLQSECEDCLALTQLLASHALEVLS